MSEMKYNLNGIAYRFPDHNTEDCPDGWMKVRYEGYHHGSWCVMSSVFVEGTNLLNAYLLINGWNSANALGGYVYIITDVVLPKLHP